MRVFYNPKFHQWQAESDDKHTAAWGDSEEDAIKRFYNLD